MEEQITRAELVAIVTEASTGCAESTRAKLRAIAEGTEAVAVGWYHCEGVGCPARQARRRNQRFQQAYDEAMSARFGRGGDFVVRVVDP